MKKHLFVPAFLAFLLVSCQFERLVAPEEEIPAPDITADVEVRPDTRTLITVDQQGEGTIWWMPADEINIFYGTTGTHYTSQNAANATTAIFRTTDVIGSTESASANIWGLYPYNGNAMCDGTSVSTTLPAAQRGVPDTFDDDLYITLAHSTSTRIKFYNVCGGVKFSLSRADITSVTFTGNNNEDLAGDVSLTFENGLPKATVVNGQKTITVTPKTGSTFTPGANYYIVALPGTLSQGFTMTFTTTGGTVATFNYTTGPVTITRSVFSRKANIDTYASFGPLQSYSRVLFIGNSITRVPISEIWWGYWGMAATTRDKDYVHRMMARLQQINPSATFDITSISVAGVGSWETNTDFYHPDVYAPDVLVAEGLPRADTDLIVIRLGENVRDDANFGDALFYLVNYLKQVAPGARVVITGQFWTNATREAACQSAATRSGSTFVQINQFDRPEYKETIGNPVYGDDGQWHTVTDQFVAAHPSDAGMQAIADAILAAIL